MNLKSYVLTGAVACAVLQTALRVTAAPVVRTNLFSTGFEYVEGFDPQFLLDGQNGWGHLPVYQGEVKIDLPVDGVVTNEFAGLGQQAWIGGKYAETKDLPEPLDQVYVWHPTIIDPIAAGTPVIKFSVLMAIEDSTYQRYDFFRWSIYNSETNRLFSLDFNNGDFTIAYQLDDDVFHVVTEKFTPNVAQHLEISMDFAANKWSAQLDGAPLVTDVQITTTGGRKTLGEIRALWLPADPAFPGDNWMDFDNFALYAESVPTDPVPPTLLTLGRTVEGFYALRLLGENGSTYALDYSADASTWTPMKTNIAYDGAFDYVDTNAPVLPQRIFRARLLSR